MIVIYKVLFLRIIKPIHDETKSGRYKYSKTNFEEHVNKSNLEGQEIEKSIIPSNIIDIYTSLEVPLGLKLSVHTNISTEGNNLIHHLYRMCEIPNEQQY